MHPTEQESSNVRTAPFSIVAPAEDTPHAQSVAEVVATLRFALEDLGHVATVVHGSVGPGPNLVLSTALACEPLHSLPPCTVIYNLEQFDPRSPWFSDRVRAALRSHVVWDYSAKNLRNLQAGGLLGDGRHVPIGYVPQLTRIESASIQDIDVLFYGSMNTRREAVLRKLGNRGLKVIHAFNAYGARRDALIARAKVVLNVHYYDSKIFEMVRVSYLLANRKAVVSEVGPDTDLEPELSSAVAAASYDGLVDAATELVRDESRRRVLEVNAFETFSARPQVRWLAPALAALPWFVSATGNAAVDPDAAHAASAGRVR